jgi:hypothetical protein
VLDQDNRFTAILPTPTNLRCALRQLDFVKLIAKFPRLFTRLSPVFITFGATLTPDYVGTSLTRRLVGLFETDAPAGLTFSTPFVSPSNSERPSAFLFQFSSPKSVFQWESVYLTNHLAQSVSAKTEGGVLLRTTYSVRKWLEARALRMVELEA